MPVVATRKQHNNNTKSKNKIHNTIRPHQVSRKHCKSLRPAAETVRGEGARGGRVRERAA